MKTIPLGKVAKIDRSIATDDECRRLPYVGLEHLEKEIGRFINSFAPTPLNMLATNFKFTSKHVLYGKLRPYLNKVALPNFDGVCTTEILPILPDENELNRIFLWAILLSPTFVSWASSQTSGANLPRLDPKLLAEYEIPLPPLPQQQRIAAILQKADRLRRLRRYARQLSDTYLQSVFLEMFGDCIDLPIVPFSNVIKIDRTIATEQECSNLPYVGLESIEKDKGMFTQDFRKEPQKMLAVNFRFTPKHILYGKLRPYLNKVVIPEFNGVCTTEILPLLPKEGKILNTYLWVYLMGSEFVKWASECVAGANLPRLAPDRLNEYQLPLASIQDQIRFDKICKKHLAALKMISESSRQYEHLFQSLLQRAFQGE